MLSKNKNLYNCLKTCHNTLRDGTGRDGPNCVLSAQFSFFHNLYINVEAIDSLIIERLVEMLNPGLNVRVFRRGGDYPLVASVLENTNHSARLCTNDIIDRIVSLGYFNYLTGNMDNFDKQKFVDSNTRFLDCNGMDGNADKYIRYMDRSNENFKDTKIFKGFVPYEFQRTENGGVRRVPVQGAEKANYAVLRRVLPDGDTVELTMKQAKNGKYEAVALESTKGKTLAELPQVKEMLLKLDSLVKRFIKVAR